MLDPAPLTATPTGEICDTRHGNRKCVIHTFNVSVTMKCKAHYVTFEDEEDLEKDREADRITAMKVAARELFGNMLFGDKEWDNILGGATQ